MKKSVLDGFSGMPEKEEWFDPLKLSEVCPDDPSVERRRKASARKLASDEVLIWRTNPRTEELEQVKMKLEEKKNE